MNTVGNAPKDITAREEVKLLETIIPTEVTNIAAWKNGCGNRGKDITSYWKDGSLPKRIAGTDGYEVFEDLYLWDYITLDSNITAPGSSVTGTKEIRIAEFDSLNNYQLTGNTDMTGFFHHLVMVPTTHFGTHGMNDSNTTEGGYAGSKMHTYVLGSKSTSGTVSAQLYSQLGALLRETRELLTKSINASGYNRFGTNSGCSSNWDWYTSCAAVLLSEMDVYGGTIWSSSGYDTGNAKKQLAAFANDEYAMFPQGIYYWLKDVVTSTIFADAGGYRGFANCSYASNANYVRPRFIIA